MGAAHQKATRLKAAQCFPERAAGEIEPGTQFQFADFFARGQFAFHDRRLQTIESLVGAGVGRRQ